MAPRILLVEDDQSLAMGLEFNLKSEGYDVTLVHDGEAAAQKVAETLKNAPGEKAAPFDLYIFDWMLPGRTGPDIVRQLRGEGDTVPVLLLTARDAKEDIVEGLDGGADDYLTKPFDLNVLLARVRSLLRGRAGRPRESAPDEARFAGIHADFNTLTAEIRGHKHRPTYKEAQSLKLLWERRNQVVTREELLQKIWGVEGYIQSRTVDNHIVQLRKLLEADPKKPKLILSIHGSGYKLVP